MRTLNVEATINFIFLLGS